MNDIDLSTVRETTLMNCVAIWKFIAEYREKNLQSPGYRTILKSVKRPGTSRQITTSPSVVGFYINLMVKLGMLRLSQNRSYSTIPQEREQWNLLVKELLK